MSGATFQTYVGMDEAGNELCELRMLTEADIPTSVDLSPPLPSDRTRRMACWPDGVLAVVRVGASPRALQMAYREGLIVRELLRMQFEAEHAMPANLMRDAALAVAPVGGTA